MNIKNYKIAKTVTEPLAIESFKLNGYTVNETTINEDWNGIDAKVLDKKLNHELLFDIKSPSKENINTGFFSFQVYDYNNVHYLSKKTEYYAFMDIVENRILCISKENLIPIINGLSLQNGRYGYQKYVLIHKDYILKHNDFILYNPNLKKSYYEKS